MTFIFTQYVLNGLTFVLTRSGTIVIQLLLLLYSLQAELSTYVLIAVAYNFIAFSSSSPFVGYIQTKGDLSVFRLTSPLIISLSFFALSSLAFLIYREGVYNFEPTYIVVIAFLLFCENIFIALGVSLGLGRFNSKLSFFRSVTLIISNFLFIVFDIFNIELFLFSLIACVTVTLVLFARKLKGKLKFGRLENFKNLMGVNLELLPLYLSFFFSMATIWLLLQSVEDLNISDSYVGYFGLLLALCNTFNGIVHHASLGLIKNMSTQDGNAAIKILNSFVPWFVYAILFTFSLILFSLFNVKSHEFGEITLYLLSSSALVSLNMSQVRLLLAKFKYLINIVIGFLPCFGVWVAIHFNASSPYEYLSGLFIGNSVSFLLMLYKNRTSLSKSELITNLVMYILTNIIYFSLPQILD